MPNVNVVTTVPANGYADVDLGVFNRFGGGGGGVQVKSTVAAADAGNISADLNIGSDQPAAGAIVPVESSAGVGPDGFTRALEGRGAPGDPIQIRLRNSSAGAIDVTSAVMIINLAA